MALIDLTYHTALAAPVAETSTAMRVDPNQVDLCDTLTNHGKHVVLTVFNARYSELVLATACTFIDGIQHVTIQRGFGGTTVRAWDRNTCVCVSQIVNACATDDPGAPGSCVRPLAGVRPGACIQIDGADTCTPTIGIRPTGVVAMRNNCIEINECGQVVWISPTFPYDCLPVYDPCSPCASCGSPSGGGGGGGATGANNISFNSGGSTTYAIGPDVASALLQLDAALAAVAAASAGAVQGVGQGQGIQIGGTSANPVIGLAPVFGTPGEYDGFIVNEFGQITDYVQTQATQHIGTAPISVQYSALLDAYTYSIATATALARGAVQLVDPGVITAGGTPNGNHVMSWNALVAWRDHASPELTTVNGVKGSTGVFNTDRTIELDFLGLPAATAMNAGSIAFVEGLTHKRIGRYDASRELGGAYASAIINMPSGAVVASKGIASISVDNPGDYVITMAALATLPTAYIVQPIAVNFSTPHFFTYSPINASSFRLRCFEMNGDPVHPTQLAFTVVAAA